MEAPAAADWQSSASPQALQERARLLRALREFMHERRVLEVVPPLLSAAANTDPNLEPWATSAPAVRYLPTSPEFPLKRLLCTHAVDCYALGPVFRAGESGRYHNPEFTMLEWYRLGFDHHKLANEVTALIQRVSGWALDVRHLSYRELFQRELGVDPIAASDATLCKLAADHGLASAELSRNEALDWLLGGVLCERFASNTLTVITDFPADQAALAQIDESSGLARRFEVYWANVELANGYHELGDAEELAGRFRAEQEKVVAEGGSKRPIDEHLLAAQQAGLPDCAGVALGVDRLLMQCLGAEHINEVLAFDYERA